MKKLVIIGASGHGKVIADIAKKVDKWEDIVFLDDDKNTKTCLGFEVIGTSDEAYLYKSKADFFVAIGNNKTREKVQEKLEKSGFSITTLIHPNAVIGTDVQISTGTAIMAGVIINSSTKIGKGCIINTAATVDHDNIIEDFVHLSPGTHIAGTVTIGKKSWIGIGASVVNNVTIVEGTIIGAGSLVTKSISIVGTYVGSPVRMIST